MKTELKIGDLVCLKSSSPWLTVSSVTQVDEAEPAWISVTWWCEKLLEPRSSSMIETVLEKKK